MNRVTLACLALLTACGDPAYNEDGRAGTDGAAGAGGTEGTGATGGEPEPPCEDVCFWWDDPVPLPPPGTPYDGECNPGGLTPGVCPSGFTCKRIATPPIPVCKPLTTGSITTTLDLPLPPSDDPVHVTLRFAINGGSWPVPDAGQDAGKMFVRREGSTWLRVLPLPTDASGLVDLELVPGLYRMDFHLVGPEFDDAQFPQGLKAGWLEVLDHGEATVNLERHLLHWTLAFDDTVEARTDQAVGFDLQGVYTQVSILPRPDFLSGTLALFPDTYLVKATFGQPIFGGVGVPAGTVEVDEMLKLNPGESNAEWRIPTVEATGTILVDGQGFTEERPTDVSIKFRGASNASHVNTRVRAGTPGSFAVHLLPGTYDVSLDVGASAEPHVPRASVLLQEGYRTGSGPIVTELHTQTVSGSLTLGGEPGAEVGAGSVTFTSRSGVSTELPLAPTGAATFEGSVFREGVYVVSISGNGETLPRRAPPLLRSYQPSDTPLVLDANAHLVTIPVTFDGSPLADSPTERPRGSVTLTAEDSPRVVLTKTVPALGDASVELLVPEGSWKLAYANYGPYSGVPRGRFPGQTMQVFEPGPYPLDLKSVELTINLTRGGIEPPAATPGKTRGDLHVSGAVAPVPGSGAATVTVSVFPGLQDIYLVCDPSSDECDSTWLAPEVLGPQDTYHLVDAVDLR